MSKGHTARETSKTGAQNTEERGTEQARSAGGLVTHRYAGMLAGKREREESRRRKRGGRKTEKGSAWVSCSP